MQVGAAAALADRQLLGLCAQCAATGPGELDALFLAPASVRRGGGQLVEVGVVRLAPELGGGAVDPLQDPDHQAEADHGVRLAEHAFGGQADDGGTGGGDVAAAQLGEQGGGGARVLRGADRVEGRVPGVGVGGQREAAEFGVPAELLARSGSGVTVGGVRWVHCPGVGVVQVAHCHGEVRFVAGQAGDRTPASGGAGGRSVHPARTPRIRVGVRGAHATCRLRPRVAWSRPVSSPGTGRVTTGTGGRDGRDRGGSRAQDTPGRACVPTRRRFRATRAGW